jgi:hypothetical protein
MVKGIEAFRSRFQLFENNYILIGGTACDIVLKDAGLEFRATKDLDIVLVVEALNSDFVREFWEFIKEAKYQIQEKSSGEKQYYRFQKPSNDAFPFMLELFSRQPDILQVAEGSHLTPIPVGEDLSSLSAILMDEDYYRFILSGRKVIDGLSIVDAAHLIPLKAQAWFDLTRREAAGEKIDSKAIKKHKNDVFRLFQILDPNVDPVAPEPIKANLRVFIEQMRSEDVDLKSLGIRTGSRDSILDQLLDIYHIER